MMNVFRFSLLLFACYCLFDTGKAQTGADEDSVGFEDGETTNILTDGGFFPGSRCVFPWQFEDENGETIVYNACRDFALEGKPFLSGADGSFEEAADDLLSTTGGTLGWCPHNYEDEANQEKRFRPGDLYLTASTADQFTQTKKHWGFCHCNGTTFWQRLPEFGDEGQISTKPEDAKRLSRDGCLMNSTITRREEMFYSPQCKAACDNLEGCNGFEYFRDATFNHCLLFSCIQVVFEAPSDDVVKYKKQVKRPCSQALSNLILDGNEIFPVDIVTSSPTSSPSPNPTTQDSTGNTRSPTTTSEPTGTTAAPTSTDDLTLAPSIPNVELGNDDGDDLSPAAWVVPLVIIILLLMGCAYYFTIRKKNAKEGPEFKSLNESDEPKSAPETPANDDVERA